MYNEEICYCSECGSANKKSAVVCENCESKINRGHSAFFYYLKSHIKDELKDRAVDKIYSVIKNYLLSHIYGTVLTVSVITVAASAVAVNYQPHIETVTVKRVAIQTIAEPEEKEPFVFDEDDMSYLHHVATNYDSFADYLRDLTGIGIQMTITLRWQVYMQRGMLTDIHIREFTSFITTLLLSEKQLSSLARATLMTHVFWLTKRLFGVKI